MFLCFKLVISKMWLGNITNLIVFWVLKALRIFLMYCICVFYKALSKKFSPNWFAVNDIKDRQTESRYMHTYIHRFIDTYLLEVKWWESRSVMSGFLWPHGLYSSWTLPGQNTGVGSLSLLQGIFPTQGSNPGLLDCRWILYQLSHQGSKIENVGSESKKITSGHRCLCRILGVWIAQWMISSVHIYIA